MSLSKTLHIEGATVYLWKIEETEEELCAIMGEKGRLLRQEASEKFKSSKRRLEWLAVRACVAQVLGLGVDIVYRKIGEPKLRGSNRRISISHTRGFVAVALHPNHYVGVDIQTYAPKISTLADRITSPKEYHGLPADEVLRIKALTLIFSIKESLYKALDIDFLDYRYGMETLLSDPAKTEGEVPMVFRTGGFSYFFKAQFLQTENLVLTLVSDQPYASSDFS